jgi:Clr5-like protein
MAPRNDFKVHKPGDRATMPLRNNSKVRKPAIKQNKTAWETNKDKILKLYRVKTLEEVMEEMEGSGFRAK